MQIVRRLGGALIDTLDRCYSGRLPTWRPSQAKSHDAESTRCETRGHERDEDAKHEKPVTHDTPAELGTKSNEAEFTRYETRTPEIDEHEKHAEHTTHDTCNTDDTDDEHDTHSADDNPDNQDEEEGLTFDLLDEIRRRIPAP
ncbi:hypothetical protein ATCC90586_010554 [Pythium insidiosum]|nr:hypothetical protein ATCC90586_010554 [Pythium insidiosum]